MTLSNFGEQFAAKVLERFYAQSIVPFIANRNYEGEIKKPGDRVNILSFLHDIELGDYSVGSDMTVGRVLDTEDQLVVEKRKYYNFSLDRLEDLFTYANDIPENLLENAAKVLESEVDKYVLEQFSSNTKAGNWLGINLLVTAGTQTMASLTTTATGGTIKIEGEIDDEENLFPSGENPYDGTVYFLGFHASDLYKGIRLVSTRAIVSPWWRISGVTGSTVVTVTEWDEEVAGPDFAENYTLRGIFGGDGVTFPKYADVGATDGGAWTAKTGFGFEIQAAIPTTLTKTSIYPQVTKLAEYLDFNDTPDSDRYLVLPEVAITALRNASETQPSGVADIYTGTVINGRVGRIGGFEVVKTTTARLSSRTGHPTSSGLGDQTLTAGPAGFVIPASNKNTVTFAEKWSESRVVDAENQFAKKYQGLFLYGAKIAKGNRKHAAVLYADTK